MAAHRIPNRPTRRKTNNQKQKRPKLHSNIQRTQLQEKILKLGGISIDEKEKIEKLKKEIKEKDKTIEDLREKLWEYKGRVDELREEKKRLNKRLNELEVLRLDLKLKNIQTLEDENNRLKHRAQITKKLLDEAREKIETLEKTIKEFKNQKLIERIAKKEPESLTYYKKRFKGG